MRLAPKVIVSAVLVSLAAPGHAGGAGGVARTDSTFGYVEVGAADIETAIDEGRAAQAAARNVLALPDVRFGITDRPATDGQWVGLAADGKPLYTWMFRRRPGDRRPVPSSNTLRHEIGHDLFIRYLAPSSTADQYGGDAPDWLDEMAAIAFEEATVTAGRRRHAARYAREAKLLPLGQFLTMTHPEWASRPPPAPSGQSAPSGEAFKISLALSEDSPRFYATGRAFFDFLVDRTKSAAIVAELAAAFRKGERLDRWILSRTGHSGPDARLGALNAEFLAWIESDERYGLAGAKVDGVSTSSGASGGERAAGQDR